MSGHAGTSRLTVILATLAVIVLLGGLVIGRLLFAPFWIPSGSMKPTLLVGDYIAVRQFDGSEPERGDVIVFRDSAGGPTFVFRVIGMPGETVQMVEGQVVINGVFVERERRGTFEEPFAPQGPLRTLPICATPVEPGEVCVKERLVDTLPGGRRIDVLETGFSRLDNTPEVQIPADHYFVLGDNRDNAADSRMPAPAGRGLVHKDRITGRVARVIFSSKGALWNPLQWRRDRFFQEVQ
jgi:signal peptidase I